MKLKIINRYDYADKKDRASLWIGDQNVWDIGHEHVCKEVLDAIRNAYDIGKQHGIDEMRAAMPRPKLLGFDATWEDKRKRKK